MNLYIADTDNQRVRKVSPNGIITTVAGTGNYTFDGDGGPATSFALNYPYAVTVDAAGNLYIADAITIEYARYLRAAHNDRSWQWKLWVLRRWRLSHEC